MPATTLRGQLVLGLSFMLGCSLAISVGAGFAVNGLHADLGVALRGDQQLRQLLGTGFLLARARQSLEATPPRPTEAMTSLQAAVGLLQDGSDRPWLDESQRHQSIVSLQQAIGSLDRGGPGPRPGALALNPLFAELSRVSDSTRQAIDLAQRAADLKRRRAMLEIAVLSMAAVITGVVLAVRLSRRVNGPLHAIRKGVREFAGGDFDRRLHTSGDLEFAQLSDDFNQMARQLSELYTGLEQQVRTRTAELVRSERLASVGYLAAGVAHEINNPLGIIAGFGERALRQLPDHAVGATAGEVKKARSALTVICEEAFRCKGITDRLLSLATPGAAERSVESLAAVAGEVVANVTGMGSLSSRRLTVQAVDTDDLRVKICPGEIKQVLLNLIINAVDAVDPVAGVVTIQIMRRLQNVELSVTDNGVGMPAEVLQRVFEPFFSLRQSGHSGTGLGLAIAHTIVQDHGGVLSASSPGTGGGSTFTLQLPAVPTEV